MRYIFILSIFNNILSLIYFFLIFQQPLTQQLISPIPSPEKFYTLTIDEKNTKILGEKSENNLSDGNSKRFIEELIASESSESSEASSLNINSSDNKNLSTSQDQHLVNTEKNQQLTSTFYKKNNESKIPLSEPQQYIMKKINDYRKSFGLPEVKTNQETCDFAKIRAKEISTSFNHDGFSNRIEKKTIPYPSYSSLTENIAMNTDYTKVVEMWINSPGHSENMRKDTPYVCVEQYDQFYAYEGWKP